MIAERMLPAHCNALSVKKLKRAMDTKPTRTAAVLLKRLLFIASCAQAL
jgi:hypothetical protein